MDFDSIGYLEGFPNFIDNGDPLCSQTDPDIFFPVDHSDAIISKFEYYSNEREAKAICAECPYKMECAGFALERLDLQGIWGGTTQMDRRRMMRRLRTRNIAKML